MRVVLPLVALILTTAATPYSQNGAPQPLLNNPAVEAPDRPSLSVRLLEGPPGPGEAVCRDRIHEVREERGLPSLDSESAPPDEDLLIAAVDHRIDGCSVLVMRNDTSDVRPLPALPGPPRVQRIPGG